MQINKQFLSTFLSFLSFFFFFFIILIKKTYIHAVVVARNFLSLLNNMTRCNVFQIILVIKMKYEETNEIG